MEASGVAEQRRRHWDRIYQKETDQLSWYQAHPDASMELIAALDVPTDAAVIDVGGGASTLVDELHADGFNDISVLDVSPAALEVGRRRLEAAAEAVHWLREDLLAWEPTRCYDLWHDRAVFHFLVDEDDRARYRHLLDAAISPGGAVIIATFAPNGPTRCSDLPVARYEHEALMAALGGGFDVVAARLELHATPGGGAQPFTWLAMRAKRG